MGNNLDRSSSAPKPYRDIGSRKPSSPTRGEGSKSRSPSSALSSSLPLSPASPPPFALSSSGSYSSSFERSSIPSREGSITLEPLPTSAPPSFQSHSPFAALPANILSRIFSLLSAFDLLQCTLVSKEWLVLAAMDEWWEKLAMKDLQKPCILSEMLHEREQLPQLTHSSWRELYWKYRRKEALTHHPLVVAIYDYRARSQREIDLRRGEILHLIAKDDESCWWFVQRKERTADGLERQQEPASNSNEQSGQEELKKPPEDLKQEDTGESQIDVGRGNMEAENISLDTAESTNELNGESLSSGQTEVDGLSKEDQQRHQVVGSSDVRTKEERKKGWVPSGYLDHCTRKVLFNAHNTANALPSMVRAKLDFVAANAKELSFKKYDLMSIDRQPKEQYPVVESDKQDPCGTLHVSKAQWLKASLTRRNTSGGTVTLSGWIPANLVTEEVRHMVGLFDYAPACGEELSLKKGTRVALLAADENRKGWIYAQANGRRGWLPENYLVWEND